MGMFEKFGIGVLRGMNYDDLADLIDDAPELLGRKLGGALSDSGKRGGEIIGSDDLAAIESAIDDEAIEKQLIGALIKTQLKQNGENARLVLYRDVLNYFSEIVVSNKRSVLMRGFLHSPDCWVLWQFVPKPKLLVSEEAKHLFTLKGGDYSGFSLSPPTEYVTVKIIVNPETTALLADTTKSSLLDKLLIEENAAIRRGRSTEFLDDLKSTSEQIDEINEFEFSLGMYSFNTKKISIPDEAPGIAEMYRSASLALEGQSSPDKALFAFVEKLGAAPNP